MVRYGCEEGEQGRPAVCRGREAGFRDRPELCVSHLSPNAAPDGSVLKASAFRGTDHHREVVKETLPEVTMGCNDGLHCPRLRGGRSEMLSGVAHTVGAETEGGPRGTAVFLRDMGEVRWTPGSEETMTFQWTVFTR